MRGQYFIIIWFVITSSKHVNEFVIVKLYINSIIIIINYLYIR